MSFGKLEKKFYKVNKVSLWDNRIQEGLNLVTLKLKEAYEGKDEKDGNVVIIIPTKNHFVEKSTRFGRDQPINSKLIVRRKLTKLISYYIELHHNNLEPNEMTLLIKCWKSGENYMYDALNLFNLKDIEMVKHMIRNGNVKPLYKRFKEQFK